MRKTHIQKRYVEEEIVDDILCNNCGGSCRDNCEMNENFEGLIEVKVCGGYASKLGDGSTYTFSICEDCLKTMFKNFAIKPKIYGEMW